MSSVDGLSMTFVFLTYYSLKDRQRSGQTAPVQRSFGRVHFLKESNQNQQTLQKYISSDKFH